jgi:predicted glycosyltransferase
LVRRQRDYELEKLVIDHLRKLIRESRSKNTVTKITEFKDQLLELVTEPEDQIVLKYFDFVSWLNSKIENMSFSKAVSLENAG